MSEQEKKRQGIYNLLNAKTKPKFLVLPYTKQRKNLQKKSFLRKRRSGGLNTERKEGFVSAVATVIKKDPTTPIRKHRDVVCYREREREVNSLTLLYLNLQSVEQRKESRSLGYRDRMEWREKEKVK